MTFSEQVIPDSFSIIIKSFENKRKHPYNLWTNTIVYVYRFHNKRNLTTYTLPGDTFYPTLAMQCMFVCAVLHSFNVNILRPSQNGRHFADDTFKRIFMNENVRLSINISLQFVPKGLIYNIPSLVQIMAWRRLGDKLLSKPIVVRLSTHICVSRPQWVNNV